MRTENNTVPRITKWERSKNNPLAELDKDSWDGGTCYKPTVIWNEEENKWMLWYNGRHGALVFIGLAGQAQSFLGGENGI